jgi:hypothetical protein
MGIGDLTAESMPGKTGGVIYTDLLFASVYSVQIDLTLSGQQAETLQRVSLG